MPSSRHVRITRTAISPRFAMRTFLSTLSLSTAVRWDLHNCTRRMVSAMWGGEWRRPRLDEVDSTNTRARRPGPRRGAPEGLVAVADHQTAGRGRLDRRWESPAGANLLVSVLLRPGCDADRRATCAPAARGPGRGAGRLPGGGAAVDAGVAQVAQRPARRTGASWPASWPRRTSRPEGRRSPWSWGSGSTWTGRDRRRRAAPAWTTWAGGAAGRTARSSSSACSAPSTRAAAPLLDDAAGRRRPGRRGAPALRHPRASAVRVDLARGDGHRSAGLAVGDRRRRPTWCVRRRASRPGGLVTRRRRGAPAPGLTAGAGRVRRVHPRG